MSTELFCLLSLITLRIKPNLSEEIALNSEALRQKKINSKQKKQKKTQVWLVMESCPFLWWSNITINLFWQVLRFDFHVQSSCIQFI